nr:hypothetical protein [Tanacetum cinerariifolium]
VVTHGDVGAVGIGVAALGDLVADGRFDAAEVLLGDEVDHTSNRVGAVGGAGAAGQHVGALDQRKRDVVEVDRADEVGRHDAR